VSYIRPRTPVAGHDALRRYTQRIEGKTHFSALIDDAERGQSTLITRNRKPVARIVPVAEPKAREFGFNDGFGFIADDFNAPLPPDVLDEFEK
jgi:prevent-host-death family protein